MKKNWNIWSRFIKFRGNFKFISGIKISSILWIAGETGNAVSEFQDPVLAKKNIEVNFTSNTNYM